MYPTIKNKFSQQKIMIPDGLNNIVNKPTLVAFINNNYFCDFNKFRFENKSKQQFKIKNDFVDTTPDLYKSFLIKI